MSNRISPHFTGHEQAAQATITVVKKTPVRLPSRKKFEIKNYALPCFAVATGAMVGLSAPHLIQPVGFTGWSKIVVFTLGAALVSYIVNRYAVDDGADLAARGFLSASVARVGSILLVGGGLFASTYAGLTIDPVNDLKLGGHGQALVRYVDQINETVSRSVRVKPAIDAAVTDIGRHLKCEMSESCLSGRGNGGRGRVTRALEPVAVRATDISAQLENGEGTRADRLAKLNHLLGQYQTTFNQSSETRTKRRQLLSPIDASIKQEIAGLKEAMPVTLLQAYTGELEKGITISGRPEATRNVNALLRRHAASIQAALETIETGKIAPPPFPNEAGVSSTFAYIGHFIPVAALTAVIELIMPLTLWVYVLLGHIWRNFKDDPPHIKEAPRVTAPGGHHVH